MTEETQEVPVYNKTITNTDVKRLANNIYMRSDVWIHNKWRGVPVWKPPTDLWSYQEIICATRPDVLIETGTAFGGSALFFADVMESIGHGTVVTIDVNPQAQPYHPRIAYVTGSSLNLEGLRKLQLENERCMVSLDSNHSRDHVLKELAIYAPLVSVGCYLVIEDTHISETTMANLMPGPYEAMEEFMTNGGMREFARDDRPEEHIITFSPSGWYKRVVSPIATSPLTEDIPDDEEEGKPCLGCGTLTNASLPDDRHICAKCFPERIAGNELWPLICIKCLQTFGSVPTREAHEGECEPAYPPATPEHDLQSKTAFDPASQLSPP